MSKLLLRVELIRVVEVERLTWIGMPVMLGRRRRGGGRLWESEGGNTESVPDAFESFCKAPTHLQ